MASKLPCLLVLAVGLSVTAAPSRTMHPSRDQTEACLQIKAQYDQATRLNVTDSIIVDGELAHQCLLSMPFDSHNGTLFVQEFRKFIEWQSTLDVLKDPPSGYLSPAVDILGGLDRIQAQAAQGAYSSQYEFDSNITSLLSSANDGHLWATLCSTSIFTFTLGLELVSISTDGIKLPQIYTVGDADLLDQGVHTVSPVVTINGQPAVDALNDIASSQTYQDPDARYNQLFYDPPREILQQSSIGAFATRSLWPGRAHHKIQFANGTTLQQRTMASSSFPNFNYTTGQALLEATCYYLPDSDLQDIAILFIPSFLPDKTPTQPTDFANNATTFIQSALRANKTKLIIDLSLNGGGYVNSGYDLFRLFFPDEPIYAASRFRAIEQADLAGQALASLQADQNNTETDACSTTNWCVSSWVTPNQTYHYTSWTEIFGPEEQFHGNMSTLVAPQDMDSSSDLTNPIRGYGGIEQVPTTAPFRAEDILIITDGSCTSTCTIFLSLMTTSHPNIKTLVYGGRPTQTPMQTIGGSRGNQDVEINYIDTLRDAAMQYAPSEKMRDRLDEVFFDSKKLPFYVQSAAVNFKSAYRRDEGEVPLQFVYEAAGCRRFWTWENVVNPGSRWVDAARAVWGLGWGWGDVLNEGE
ncbi:hypothetical protein BO94DRAFT_608436 [Aspergillus sclerotioniger CBS 115572]|uniref:Uncharacterized protein n=1 Tax=Aspergillus sclerotioniger CBS 115572 TaxID=1450535 RepID=A0A317VCS7_9EURO|nr:hypothetical protein BO94DRAFT_608436 [Aspergillus sclerotioniger CBS 115572]PWY71795.1 hypothetical protein BO94DRAFT_608436 [Aspergillus sclerotioniger CBS 115572]